MSAPRPKVSVCVVTYNQEAYIRDCLQSLVDQNTEFPFEILVGEDCSTDNTRAIVTEFSKQHPDKIIAFLNERNLGPFENYRNVHRAARGDYIAHVDGDDYALPGKLSAQVCALDAAPDCPAVFHQLVMVDEANKPTGRHWPKMAPHRIPLGYLLVHHPIFGHSSMMYRKGLLDSLLSEEHQFIDFRVYVHLALQGPLVFLPDALGAYRQDVGVSRANYEWIEHVISPLLYAETKGVPISITNLGRARQYYLAAHNALYLRRFDQFSTLIEKSKALGHVSWAQAIMYKFRYYPALLVSAHLMYVAARGIKLARDVKQRFREEEA